MNIVDLPKFQRNKFLEDLTSQHLIHRETDSARSQGCRTRNLHPTYEDTIMYTTAALREEGARCRCGGWI